MYRLIDYISSRRSTRLSFVGNLHLPRRVVDVALILFLAATLVWIIGFRFFGLVFNDDECYMGLSCRYYRQQPIAMLSFYIGRIALNVFGDQVITLRLLAAVCYLGAMLLPSWYFYHRTGNWRWTVFITAVGLIIATSLKISYYGWDSGAIFFTSVLLTLLTAYIHAPSKWKAMAVGAGLAALILARVPSSAIALPAMLYGISTGCRRHGYMWRTTVVELAYVAAAFIVTALLLVMLMTGGITEYIACWTPENIITGHNVRDFMHGFLPWLKWDAMYITNIYWIRKYYFLSLLLLVPLLPCSRLLPGVVFTLCLSYRAVACEKVLETDYYFIGLTILLYPFVHNILNRYRAEGRSLPRIDIPMTVLVVLFALLPAIGSDRMLMRVSYFYSYPLLMINLYRWRNGMLLWCMLLMAVPALSFGISRCIDRWRTMEPMEHVVPYHSMIMEHVSFSDYISPLGGVVERLRHEGKRYSAFGEFRYGPMYLYDNREPFMLNSFHYYYKDDTRRLLGCYTDSLDAIIVAQQDLKSMSYREIRAEIEAKGFECSDTAGMYEIFIRNGSRN